MERPDLRQAQLKGYLKEFYVKPDLSKGLWSLAEGILRDRSSSAFRLSFASDLDLKRFCQAVLLSQGRQVNWFSGKSYQILQDNLANERLLTEYSNFDLAFILHEAGTIQNSFMPATLNQLAVLRSPKLTFLLDRGGPPLPDLSAYKQVLYGLSALKDDLEAI